MQTYITCGSCEEQTAKPDNENQCSNCGSGNWIYGDIDTDRPTQNLQTIYDNLNISKIMDKTFNQINKNIDKDKNFSLSTCEQTELIFDLMKLYFNQ